MAVFKANYVKRGKEAKQRAKASVRYIQHRRGKDNHTITRQLFGSDGALDRYDAYRIIDEAKKGSFFYRFVLSPDPKREDNDHDLDMRDIAYQTMQQLEERLGQSVLWVGAIHSDHAPHLHAHLIAVVPQRLYVKDFESLRQRVTEACLEQRRFLDLTHTNTRERPYPLPTFATSRRYAVSVLPRHGRSMIFANSGSTPASGPPPYARHGGRFEKISPLHLSRARPAPTLHTCTCPRCEAVHIHNLRDPVQTCNSCGLTLHRQKQLRFTRERKGAGWQL